MRLNDLAKFFDALQYIRGKSQLLCLLHELTHPSGISGVFIARLPELGEDITPNIIIRGWSEQWIEEYALKGYVRDDPIAKELRLRNSLFVWSEVCSSRKLSNAEIKVMREAKSAGLEDGLTVPVLDVGEKTTCVSFSTGVDGPGFDREGRQTLQTIASLTVAKLEELDPLAGNQKKRTSVADLAPREAQCLALAGRGMTSKQIERQTGLSFRTIDFYIGRAMQKLNARNRTEAVNLAHRYRLVELTTP